MRIIGGKFRGRKLKAPKDQTIRPTTDRLRESIFNVLEHRLGGLKDLIVADFFAGTGAFGLECISRGAKLVTFIEKSPSSLKILNENISLFGLDEEIDIAKIDARNLPANVGAFDLIFLDPPYGKDLIEPTLKEIVEKNWVGSGGMIVVEGKKGAEYKIPTELEKVKTLIQGNREVQFFFRR